MVNVPSSVMNIPENTVTFNVTRLALVPVFREAEVEAYFGAFEQIAAALNGL